jgi:bis(5'-nucleosyl)-tetraphosphatase (symmetrical)
MGCFLNGARNVTSLYAIGDLQGCSDALDRLLARLPTRARLVFVGDLVNRGPDSLGTLRRIMGLGNRAIALLGNHDLHFLAVAAGIRKMHDDDTLQDILDAPDAADLIHWIRHRPLAYAEAGALFVHAGILPSWTTQQTLQLADEIHAQLRGPGCQAFLASMYGNKPPVWRNDLRGADRWRCILNAMTRLRFVANDGTMDLKRKGSPDDPAPGYFPWYRHPHRAWRGSPVIFGHWSTAGLVMETDAIGIDTGCLWGGKLTAMAWPERTLIQQACPQARSPGNRD